MPLDSMKYDNIIMHKYMNTLKFQRKKASVNVRKNDNGIKIKKGQREKWLITKYDIW